LDRIIAAHFVRSKLVASSLDILASACPARCAVSFRLVARRQSRQSRALWHAMPCWPPLQIVRISFANSSRLLRVGGAYRDRTDDLMLAKQPLSQLS
jgi:hypothetical protein